MRNILAFVIFSLVPFLVIGEEWSDIRQTGFGNAITVTSTQYEASISWPDSVVAGGVLLFTVEEDKSMGIKSYRNYTFNGIVNNSLKVSVRGADSTPLSPSAKDDPSIVETYYIERFTDNSFYFIPKELRGKGPLKITASADYPGTYEVQFSRIQ